MVHKYARQSVPKTLRHENKYQEEKDMPHLTNMTEKITIEFVYIYFEIFENLSEKKFLQKILC